MSSTLDRSVLLVPIIRQPHQAEPIILQPALALIVRQPQLAKPTSLQHLPNPIRQLARPGKIYYSPALLRLTS